LRLAAPRGGAGIALLALLDTGADVTLIPERLVRTLDLPVISQVRVAGLTGTAVSADVLAVAIELFGRSFLAEAVGFGGEAIVGRDLLNRLVLRLDGPRRMLEVGRRAPRRKER
jgi:predicted aspartyl protease